MGRFTFLISWEREPRPRGPNDPEKWPRWVVLVGLGLASLGFALLVFWKVVGR